MSEISGISTHFSEDQGSRKGILLGAPRVSVFTNTLTRFAPYALVPVVFAIGAATIQGYASKSNLLSLLVLSSLLGLASIGETLTIIGGGIDLSIPSVIGLADVVVTQLYADRWPFWLACLLIGALALAVGAFNALASLMLRVHPLVITLAVGLIVEGGVLTWRHALFSGTVPSWLVSAVSVIGRTGPIPVPEVVIVWVVLSSLTIGFQRLSRLGRELYASGANPVAARMALVRTTWAWVVAFSLSALFAALVGVLFAGFSGQADISVGQPYLFDTIAAVVIGGTSLLGGRGGYGRTIVGVLIISQLSTLLIGAGFGSGMQEALLGLLVVLLVAVYGREPHVSTRI
jgi:ribose transport system permease protein